MIAPHVARSVLQNGKVVEFDAHVGLGTVEADDGARYPFHCTQIADGTRTVPVGAAVTFEVVAGPLGRYEATALTRGRPS
jgi:cold shock CspA family protein